MSVEMPYNLEEFSEGLKESFKKSVADTAQVESFRVEQLTVSVSHGDAGSSSKRDIFTADTARYGGKSELGSGWQGGKNAGSSEL